MQEEKDEKRGVDDLLSSEAVAIVHYMSIADWPSPKKKVDNRLLQPENRRQ